MALRCHHADCCGLGAELRLRAFPGRQPARRAAQGCRSRRAAQAGAGRARDLLSIPSDTHRPRLPARSLRRADEVPGDEGRLRRAQPDPRPPELAERRRRRDLDRVLPADRRRTRACSSTTSPTRTGTRGSWATSTRTFPRPRARSTPCSRRPSSSRSSSSTARSTRRSRSSAWRSWDTRRGSYPDGRLNPDDRFKMIDPACGSGHFLLGSFARLVERWRRKEPGAKAAVLVQRALDGVHGVDLNPYAIAIARFRLLLAGAQGVCASGGSAMRRGSPFTSPAATRCCTGVPEAIR